jgi:hypothetical protein
MSNLPRGAILLIGFVAGLVIGALAALLTTLIVSRAGLQSTADALGGFATTIATIFGIPALFLAWMQISANIKSQNEATAYSIYGEQLKLGLAHPEFAIASPQEISNRPEEYEQFMRHLLYACENIFVISEPEGWSGWIAAIQKSMSPHMGYLAKHLPTDRALEPSFRDFLQGMVEEHQQRKGITANSRIQP